MTVKKAGVEHGRRARPPSRHPHLFRSTVYTYNSNMTGRPLRHANSGHSTIQRPPLSRMADRHPVLGSESPSFLGPIRADTGTMFRSEPIELLRLGSRAHLDDALAAFPRRRSSTFTEDLDLTEIRRHRSLNTEITRQLYSSVSVNPTAARGPAQDPFVSPVHNQEGCGG